MNLQKGKQILSFIGTAITVIPQLIELGKKYLPEIKAALAPAIESFKKVSIKESKTQEVEIVEQA